MLNTYHYHHDDTILSIFDRKKIEIRKVAKLVIDDLDEELKERVELVMKKGY
jgi:hypothetical protein